MTRELIGKTIVQLVNGQDAGVALFYSAIIAV